MSSAFLFLLNGILNRLHGIAKQFMGAECVTGCMLPRFAVFDLPLIEGAIIVLATLQGVFHVTQNERRRNGYSHCRNDVCGARLVPDRIKHHDQPRS
jgi:hypothetical protein